MPESQVSGPRTLLLGLVAAAMHGLFDLVTTQSRLFRPPYLRLEDAPEVFSRLSPVTVSVATSLVSGVIALLAIAVVEPRRGHRVVPLGLAIAGFWAFSALLTLLVWLETPWSLAATSVPLALPRGLAIGWTLARLSPPPAPAPTSDASSDG